MREEKDFLGSVKLPGNAMYGIHAWRSTKNFPLGPVFHEEWYRAVGLVKQACYQCIVAFHSAATGRYPASGLPAGLEDATVFELLEKAAAEIAAGKHFDHFIVPAMQGGAGTSINMNINEILSNVALVKKGMHPGNYVSIDPYKHANLFQ